MLLVGAEVAAEVGAAEFVVVSGGAERALDHDVERRGDVRGTRWCAFPGLRRLREVEVGDGEAAETGLGFCTAAGGAFVTDLAACAGGCAGPGRDRGGMVVGLHLHDDVDLFVVSGEDVGLGVREEARRRATADDRGVVAVGGENVFVRGRVGVADHREEGPLRVGRDALRAGFARRKHALNRVAIRSVNRPRGVEDLVAAVLAVGLCEHVELDVGGVAAEGGEFADEVVDFVGSEGQAEAAVGFLNCSGSA